MTFFSGIISYDAVQFLKQNSRKSLVARNA